MSIDIEPRYVEELFDTPQRYPGMPLNSSGMMPYIPPMHDLTDRSPDDVIDIWILKLLRGM